MLSCVLKSLRYWKSYGRYIKIEKPVLTRRTGREVTWDVRNSKVVVEEGSDAEGEIGGGM